MVYLDKLHVENESRMRRNGIRYALCAVCKVRGNEETVFRTLFHQLYALCPSGNHAVERESSRFATVDRAVKHGAVEKLARIMHSNLVGC